MFRRNKEQPQEEGPTNPQNPFDGLRRRALGATAELAGFTAHPPDRTVYGAVMDWALDGGGLATVFALEDGTGSLYLSSGGGVIGGQFHESIRQAVRAFILSFEPFVASMAPDPDGSPPPAGFTDLRALTAEGRRVVRAPTGDFGQGRHPMSNVFHAGQALITALRQAPPTRELRPRET
jgi:hypothetical protein